jgi:Mycobacterium membrane protein
VKGNRVALCVLLVAVGSAVGGCGRLGHSNSDIAGVTIRYQVEYDSTAIGHPSQRALSISYATSDGEKQQTDVGLPWTKVVSAGAGFAAVVRAQYAGSGLIGCRVVADGKVIDQQISVGPYAVVECSST